MDALKVRHIIFNLILTIIVFLWFISAVVITLKKDGNQVLISEADYFECTEGWYDDEGNVYDMSNVSFTKDDIGKEFVFHYQIPTDISFGDNYSICFFTRGMNLNVCMRATEDSPYYDPEEYGTEYFYKYNQNGSGIAGNDIGLVVQIVPLYWADIGNEVTFEVTPTEDTAFFSDMRIQLTSEYIYSILRPRMASLFASLTVLFFGLATFFYTFFSSDIKASRRTGYYSLAFFSIVAGMLLLIETQVIQILTGKPELLSALKYLLFLVVAYPLAVFVDSTAKAPHKHISPYIGIVTVVLIVVETTFNLLLGISYHHMVMLSSVLVIIDLIMTIYLMFKDIKYCSENEKNSPTYPTFMAVLILMMCTISDLIFFLSKNGHVTDHAELSRIGYVIFIVVLLLRLLQLSLSRDRKAMLAEKYHNEARTDALTGLYNKHAYMEKEIELSSQLWEAAKNGKYDYEFIVMALDLNNLKKVNDSSGHATGDLYIKDGADILRKALDNHGEIYRVGGDEFTIIIEEKSCEELYAQIVKQLKYYTNLYNENNAYQIALGFAYGHAICSPTKIDNIYEAEQAADKEMYDCKRAMKIDIQ